ncbi:MAG: glycosyltransferase family 2 protein [Patescibacteria group bacterium]
MKNKKNISVIILAKNEEKSIGKVILGAKPYADELLVIDGHSKDKTRQIARKMGVKVFLDHGLGKGEAVRLGIKKAQKEILVFIDADGSHDPKDIPKLARPILEGKADHVTGSRMLGGSDELHGTWNKFLRETGSHLIILGINWRFGTQLTDGQNGFRAIRRKVAQKLNLKEDITTIEQEMIIKTLKSGFRMAEVPTHEYRRQNGESSIILRKVWWRYVYTWLKYLFFD